MVTCMKIIKKIKHGYESIIYHQQRIHGVKREALYILLILNLCQLMRDRAVCFYLAAVWNDCLQVHSTIHGFCNFLSFCGLASYSLFIHGRWFQDHDYLSSFIFSSFLFPFSSLITFSFVILNGIKTALKLEFRYQDLI